jgi:hypothetical protein
VNTPSVLDYITAIGSLATPILVLVLTGIGWTIRNRYEKTREIEQKLREDRINIYNDILEPFVILLTKDEGMPTDKGYRGKSKGQIANEKILSLKYRQTAFKLALIGSDNVVKAYNNLMQFFFNREPEQIPENESRGYWACPR